MAQSHHETRIKAISGWNCGTPEAGACRCGARWGAWRVRYGCSEGVVGARCRVSGEISRSSAPSPTIAEALRPRGAESCACRTGIPACAGRASRAFTAQDFPESNRSRGPETARRMPGQVVRDTDEHDAADPHEVSSHFRARAACGAEPGLQALDAPEEEGPDRQQVPGKARHGREEGEGWHRGA